MSAPIGYVVLAKRPDRHRDDGLDYQAAGGIWSAIDPVENHQAYCQMAAAENPERYGDVEYVIGEIRIVGGGS